jgi:F-type H+-transporting ATPase subunit b
MNRPAFMRFRGKAGVFGLSVLLFLVLVVPAIAQESEPSPADSSVGWVFRWLNFAIVFIAIVYAAVKGGGPYFRARTEEIAAKVAEGKLAREKAERQRQEVQAKMAEIAQEVAQIREEAKRSEEAETVRLRALAKRDAETIERAAQAEIVAAQRSAFLELKALAARRAVEGAEVLLQKDLTPQTESALLHRFVAELAGNAN